MAAIVDPLIDLASGHHIVGVKQKARTREMSQVVIEMANDLDDEDEVRDVSSHEVVRCSSFVCARSVCRRARA
jgi:hypothetical protein